MAQTRKRGGNRRKKESSRRPFVALALIVLALVLAFVALEKLKRSSEDLPPVRAGEERRQKMPLRTTADQVTQKGYSSPPTAASKKSATGAGTLTETPAKPAKTERSAGAGRIAIIVDDMGNSLDEANALIAINIPLTFSVIPGLPKSRSVAETAHGRGVQVMVHIPMEPRGYERKPFEKNGLLLSMSDPEIVRHLDGYFRAVPYAVGANNHMGSRFTEDRVKMRLVLGVLKEKGLFFIDSKTTPLSVGDKLSRELGIATASRNVFLDNEQNVSAIRKQLTVAAESARKNGNAVAICHPHRTTIQALAETMPELKKSGITFVYASEIVR